MKERAGWWEAVMVGTLGDTASRDGPLKGGKENVSSISCLPLVKVDPVSVLIHISKLLEEISVVMKWGLHPLL